MASAGPYASLHLAPDRQPHQHHTTLFLQTGRPSCHPANSVKALKALDGKSLHTTNAATHTQKHYVTLWKLVTHQSFDSRHTYKHTRTHASTTVASAEPVGYGLLCKNNVNKKTGADVNEFTYKQQRCWEQRDRWIQRLTVTVILVLYTSHIKYSGLVEN